MKLIQCTSCGSTELTEVDGYSICDYCQSRFVPKADETISKKTTLGGLSDVELLLQKLLKEGIRVNAVVGTSQKQGACPNCYELLPAWTTPCPNCATSISWGAI